MAKHPHQQEPEPAEEVPPDKPAEEVPPPADAEKAPQTIELPS